MSKKRIDYDGDKQLITVYRRFDAAKTLVPKEEIQKWTAVLADGEDDQGRSVETVRYVFADPQTAKYNQQPLSFAKIETYISTDDGDKPLGDGPEFSVREDFGIDGK